MRPLHLAPNLSLLSPRKILGRTLGFLAAQVENVGAGVAVHYSGVCSACGWCGCQAELQGLTLTCCATPAALRWLTRGMIPGRCRPTWGTRTYSTRCAIPSWHRIASRISDDKGERLSGSSRHNGTIMHKPMPMMIADITISIRSAVGHQEVRVAGSVMSLLPIPLLGEKRRKECELVHNR